MFSLTLVGGKAADARSIAREKKIYCSLIEPLSSLGKMQPGLTRGSTFTANYSFFTKVQNYARD